MKPETFYHTILEPTLQMMSTLCGIPVTDEARLETLTIAGFESKWTYRLQIGGPARGFWQFEGGNMSGLAQVLQMCPIQVAAVCKPLEVPYTNRSTLFEALAWNDTLACALARLLLWQNPHALPKVGECDAAYQYYVSCWHPGAPRPEDWPDAYNRAMDAIGLSTSQGKLAL